MTLEEWGKRGDKMSRGVRHIVPALWPGQQSTSLLSVCLPMPCQTLMASLLPKEVCLAGKELMLVLKMQKVREKNLIHLIPMDLGPWMSNFLTPPKSKAVSAFWRHSSIIYISFAVSTNSYGLKNFICQPTKWQHNHFPLSKLTSTSHDEYMLKSVP